MSLNRAIIMGNLGQDPELRYTQSGMPVCTFSIATTEYRTDRDGNRQESTEWHRIVVWNKQAENCAKYLAKGRTALVEGRIQTRSWDDQNGVKRYTTEIVANNIQFVGGVNRDSSHPRDDDAPAYGGSPAGARPSYQGSANGSRVGSSGFGQDAVPNISDGGPNLEEIPF